MPCEVEGDLSAGRCRFLKMGDTWFSESWAWVNPKMKSAGSWLQERVTSKGVWGLGCRVCNFAVERGKPCFPQMRPFVRGVLRKAHCITRQHLVRHSECKFHRESARHWLGGHLDRGAPSVGTSKRFWNTSPNGVDVPLVVFRASAETRTSEIWLSVSPRLVRV